MPIVRCHRPSLAGLLGGLALGMSTLAVGCTPQRDAVHSEPPTYSYVHDEAAQAELALWPTVATGLTLAGRESAD